MSAEEVTLERGDKTVTYRPVVVAHNWEKSKFEYFNTHLGEWREVINWNSRERLFGIYSA